MVQVKAPDPATAATLNRAMAHTNLAAACKPLPLAAPTVAPTAAPAAHTVRPQELIRQEPVRAALPARLVRTQHRPRRTRRLAPVELPLQVPVLARQLLDLGLPFLHLRFLLRRQLRLLGLRFQPFHLLPEICFALARLAQLHVHQDHVLGPPVVLFVPLAEVVVVEALAEALGALRAEDFFDEVLKSGPHFGHGLGVQMVCFLCRAIR